MFDLIREGWKRLVRFFTGEEVSPEGDVAESPDLEIPVTPLSTSSVPAAENELSEDLSKWMVTEYLESPFEKVGRLYVEADNLVIRSDLDDRGFYLPLVDVTEVLAGNPRPFLLIPTGEQVGVAKVSTSGKAMNFWIDPVLYTSPLVRVMDVLEGRARKAAVFVGREGCPLFFSRAPTGEPLNALEIPVIRDEVRNFIFVGIRHNCCIFCHQAKFSGKIIGEI